MLTEEEVKALFMARIVHLDQGNSFFLNHLRGQLRALVAVVTGEAPSNTDSLTDHLDALRIPYTLDDDEVIFDDPWLVAHGFQVTEGSYWHPRFSAQSW